MFTAANAMPAILRATRRFGRRGNTRLSVRPRRVGEPLTPVACDPEDVELIESIEPLEAED